MKTFLKILILLVVLVGIYGFVFYKTPQQRTFEKTLAAAQAGDMQAAFNVAGFYAKGTGLPAPDGQQAAAWYRKSAADGNMQAARELAYLYIQGKVLPQNLEEAAVYLQLAAQASDAASQLELARFYAEGLGGLPVHPREALYWQMKAAEQGNEFARQIIQTKQQEDPLLYEEVSRFNILLEKADEGDAQSQLEAGQGFHNGYPRARNDEEAFRLFTQAWESGQLPQAAYELSQLYQKGEGTEKNEIKAMDLLTSAVQSQNPDAQYMFGTFAYGANPPKYEDAFAWFSNAAAAGQAPGQYMTGFMLMQGQGTPKSVPLAIEFFRKAAEQNHVAAQYVLGQIYWKGLGVAVDKQEGEKWLRRAAEGGNEAAKNLLAEKSS